MPLALEAVLTTGPPVKYCFTFKKKKTFPHRPRPKVHWGLWSRRSEATARRMCSVWREAQVWGLAKVSGSQGR